MDAEFSLRRLDGLFMRSSSEVRNPSWSNASMPACSTPGPPLPRELSSGLGAFFRAAAAVRADWEPLRLATGVEGARVGRAPVRPPQVGQSAVSRRGMGCDGSAAAAAAAAFFFPLRRGWYLYWGYLCRCWRFSTC